jgi:DNA-binding CsgD family transcriptional regulator
MSYSSGLTKREKKVLSIIRENSEGITLPETAYLMDMSLIDLAKDMKRLLKKGEIKKKNNKYFSV